MGKIIAWTCKNFEEYDEFGISENPNFVRGDGECRKGERVDIFNSFSTCPSDCKSYEVYSG